MKTADAGLKDYGSAYRHRFTYLHTPPNALTGQQPPAHHAPNKPLFLLTLIDLLAQGLITANWIRTGGAVTKVTVTGHHKLGRRAYSWPVTVTALPPTSPAICSPCMSARWSRRSMGALAGPGGVTLAPRAVLVALNGTALDKNMRAIPVVFVTASSTQACWASPSCYQVMATKARTTNSNLAGHLLTLQTPNQVVSTAASIIVKQKLFHLSDRQSVLPFLCILLCIFVLYLFIGCTGVNQVS